MIQTFGSAKKANLENWADKDGSSVAWGQRASFLVFSQNNFRGPKSPLLGYLKKPKWHSFHWSLAMKCKLCTISTAKESKTPNSPPNSSVWIPYSIRQAIVWTGGNWLVLTSKFVHPEKMSAISSKLYYPLLVTQLGFGRMRITYQAGLIRMINV